MKRLWLIPAGFLAGALLSRAILAHAPQTIAIDLAQPIAVVTYWKTFGLWMCAALFATLAFAAVPYIAALKARRLPGVGTIAAISAAACAAALLFPAIFSSDVYAYAAYGDLAAHGISPYAHAHVALHDPLMLSAFWQWSNPLPRCAYGPAFVWIARVIFSGLQALGTAAPLWGLRALACASLVLCAPLAAAAYGGNARRRSFAAAGIALNPLAIWVCAEGHNDVMMLAVVLTGFALARRSALFGAFVVALGALIKAPALAACAGALIVLRHDRARLARFACGTLAGVLVLALAYAPPLLVLRGPQTTATTALITTGMPLAHLYPWYALWLIPLALLWWNAQASRAILAFSFALTLRYLPDATWQSFPPAAGALLTLAELAPVAFFLALAIPRGLARPAPKFE